MKKPQDHKILENQELKAMITALVQDFQINLILKN